MNPLVLLALAGGSLFVYGKAKQAKAEAEDDGAVAGDSGTADRDAALHDEIIPSLNAVLPGTQAIANLIGEETVEDISDFFAEVDDRNRQNIENLSNDLARFDDNVRAVTTKIFAPVTNVFRRWF